MTKRKGHFPPVGSVMRAGSGVVQFRPGEGVMVQAQHLTSEGDGFGLAIALGSAPVPERKYVADVYYVHKRSDSVKLMFGQVKATGAALRSLLVIHTTHNGVLHLLSAMEAMKNPTIQEIADRENIAPEKVDVPLEEPPQTVALSANMGIAAVSGRESCIDFYHASPFALAACKAGRDLAVDPVVRIDLPTGLFLSYIDEIRKITGMHGRGPSQETPP